MLLATLANVDGWEKIEYFAQYQEEYLRIYIELKNEIPSYDTIRRVFWLISPDILQRLYLKWQELLIRDKGEKLKKIVCMDGKREGPT